MEIKITEKEFKSLSQDAQKELITLLYGESPAMVLHHKPIKHCSINIEQAKRLYSSLSEKSRKFLLMFGSYSTKEDINKPLRNNTRIGMVYVEDICKRLKMDNPRKLSGIQSGITKRLRSIVGDQNAYLLEYDHNTTVKDERGNWIDGAFWVTEETCNVLMELEHQLSSSV
jgi:hypothetical protein